MYSKLNTAVKSLLPPWLYEQLVGTWDKNGFKKYFANTSWIFFAKIITFTVSFLTIAMMARYLGPENLGKLSYAQSFIAIFSMFASLGIDQIVYRDLVAHPKREGEILGTAIATKLFFGALTFIVTVCTALVVQQEPLLTWLIGIIALSFIFQPLGVIGHVFNARVLSKYQSILSVVIALVIPLLKLTIIWLDQGILYFAVIISLEALIVSGAYVVMYKTILGGSLRSLSFSRATFTQLLQDSWPITLIGLSGYLYARIDQVMIQHFIDSTSVGLYEAAVRLTEPLGFFPGMVVGSLFPALINARKHHPMEYRKRLRALVLVCMSISVGLATVIFIIAPYLVAVLYGPEYAASATILRIYIWSNVGTVATLLMYTYFVAENRTKLQLIYTSIGAILNIILNAILIPYIGITGAAYATLATVTVVVGGFLCTRRWL